MFLMPYNLGSLKFPNNKEFRKSLHFFCTVYRVYGEAIFGSFPPIVEYSSTVKNRRNSATVNLRIVVKGICKKMWIRLNRLQNWPTFYLILYLELAWNWLTWNTELAHL
jgi:hypothetical protein